MPWTRQPVIPCTFRLTISTTVDLLGVQNELDLGRPSEQLVWGADLVSDDLHVVGLDVGRDRGAHECRERADVFWSLDNFEVLRCEVFERDAAFAYIEEPNVIGAYDEIGHRVRLAVLDVDFVWRRKDGEAFIFDKESYRQVWTIFDTVQSDS